MKDAFDLLGRIMLGSIFISEAYDAVIHFETTKAKMTEYHLTWQQDTLIYGAILFLILGAIMLIIGYRASLGSLLLFFYWIPVTFTVHQFWKIPYSEQRIESIEFMKNIAIAGGLLMVYVNGSGRYSVRRLLATTRVRGVKWR